MPAVEGQHKTNSMVCLEVPYLIMLYLGITFIILFSLFLFSYRSCERVCAHAYEGFFFVVVFYGISVYANMCAFVFICVSCAFSLAFSPDSLCVTAYSSLFGFIFIPCYRTLFYLFFRLLLAF